jgi:hypothetical protein
VTIPRLLLLVLLVVACTVLGVAVVALSERDQAAGSERLAVSSGAPVDGPVSVLHAWDQRRAAAWAAGDVSGLRALYTERSTAGERDAARLTQWLERGLRVRKMQTQVLRAQVLEKRPGVLALSVTDRIVRAVATGRGQAVPLPADSPSAWRITMRRVRGEWRVASVYASPVARTSSTPGSANR